MPLKVRLLLSIAAALVLALALGGAVLVWQARSTVQAEVRGTFQGAQRQVRATLKSDVQHTVTVRQLVEGFNGMRHARLEMVNEKGKVIVASHVAPVFHPAPDWFVSLVAPPMLKAEIPIPMPGFNCTVVLYSDAGNEISGLWQMASDAFTAMAAFAAVTFLLVWLGISRSLRFFRGIAEGLNHISQREYDARMALAGPPEFRMLAEGFNHMAEKLSSYRQSTLRLQRQIMGLQEEERAEIARDLHDEVGPYLFAIQVDADAIAKTGDAKARERAGSIREAALHVQRQVKSILRQLNPVSGLAFGLQTAIDDLIAFWSPRHPQIRFERSLDPAIRLERRVEETAYRIVQESVSNAVRHGRPSHIRIALVRERDGAVLRVEDDGGGFATANQANMSQAGMGLKGMAERVRLVSGQFHIENSGGGVVVRAILPAVQIREKEVA